MKSLILTLATLVGFASFAYNWEELTVEEFAAAAKETKGTVVVPFGCVEKHGRHLPLGTDTMAANYIVRKAAEVEPVLIFSIGYLGAVAEAKHKLGTVAVSTSILRQLFEEMCEEFARNGCTNIVVVNEHGGNADFLKEFCRSRLEKPRPYNFYIWEDRFSSAQYKEWKNRFGMPKVWGHACVYETSLMLAIRPDLVHLDRSIPEEAQPKARMDHFGKNRIITPIDWYALCDSQVYGDPAGANKEMGEWFTATSVSNLIEALRVIKNDTTPQVLNQEFYKFCAKPQL